MPAERVEVLVAEVRGALLCDRADPAPRRAVEEPHALAHALADGVLAGGPREDEVDAREQVLVLEQLDHLGAPRRAERRGRRGLPLAPRRRPAAGPGRCRREARRSPSIRRPSALTAWPSRRSTRTGRVVVAALDRDAVVQVDGARALDDDLEGAAHRREPLAEDHGVGDGRRQAHERDVGRGQDQDLLPDAAAVGVLEEVHLVEDDDAEALELGRAREQHVAQHLGRHDDDRRGGPDRHVAGEEPDGVVAVLGAQVRELLVRQRLERRRVEGLAPRGARDVDAVGGDERLAGARRARSRAPSCPGRARRVPRPGRDRGGSRRTRRTRRGPLGPSLPEQLPDADGREVEAMSGIMSSSIESGSPVGVKTAARTVMMMTAGRHHLSSWAGSRRRPAPRRRAAPGR